jgi:hypothetical protein
MKKLIEARHVKPGQEFHHYGLTYRRATDDEAARHPGRELAARQNRDLVFAYQGDGDGRQPVQFVPDLRIVVDVQKRRVR